MKKFGENNASLLAIAVEHSGHGLVRKLDTSKRCCVGGHGSSHGRPDAREEGFEATARMDSLDGPAYGRASLCALQAGLDCVNREDGYPHGDTCSTTGHHDGRHAERPGQASDGILGGELSLDGLVGGEVEG